MSVQLRKSTVTGRNILEKSKRGSQKLAMEGHSFMNWSCVCLLLAGGWICSASVFPDVRQHLMDKCEIIETLER